MSDLVMQAKQAADMARDVLVKTLDAVPDDRLTWSPSPTAKSALRTAAHAGLPNQAFAGIWRGEELPGAHLEEISEQMDAAEKAITSREQAIQLIEGSVAAGTMPFFMNPPGIHMSNHAAQVDYLQTTCGNGVGQAASRGCEKSRHASRRAPTAARRRPDRGGLGTTVPVSARSRYQSVATRTWPMASRRAAPSPNVGTAARQHSAEDVSAGSLEGAFAGTTEFGLYEYGVGDEIIASEPDRMEVDWRARMLKGVSGQASGAWLPKHRSEWLGVQPAIRVPGPTWGIPAGEEMVSCRRAL